MKAMFAIMPEFDFLRRNLESAPMRRARHVIRKTGLERGNLCSKRVARFQRARLCGSPGPDPAAASARGKIVIGSRGACLADRTCHANLAAQALPVKAESGLASRQQLAGLAALIIGEEKETIEDVIEPFLIQQGFLQRTPRGRIVSQRAYLHFGFTPSE